MYKSISQWAFPAEMSIEEMMQTAKDLGYDAFEPAVMLDGPLSPQSSDRDFMAVKEAAQRIGIRLAALASNISWRVSPTANDPMVREQAYLYAVRQLQAAQILGVGAILFVPGLVGPEGDGIVDYADAWQRAVDMLRRLEPVARECGVVIGVENVWNNLILSPKDMLAMLDEVNSPWVQCYLDVGNVIRTGWAQSWVKMLAGRIVRVHVKDYDRANGTINGFCPMLTGDVDYPAVMAELRRAGYDLDLTAEVASGMDSIRHTIAALDKIVAM